MMVKTKDARHKFNDQEENVTGKKVLNSRTEKTSLSQRSKEDVKKANQLSEREEQYIKKIVRVVVNELIAQGRLERPVPGGEVFADE